MKSDLMVYFVSYMEIMTRETLQLKTHKLSTLIVLSLTKERKEPLEFLCALSLLLSDL